MSLHSVEKIGGTSMSATDALFDNILIADRTEAELYKRIFVVSAYGGMTDLLLENKKSGLPGVYGRFLANEGDEHWHGAMDKVRQAMHARNAAIFTDKYSHEEANIFVNERIALVTSCLNDLARLRQHGHFCLKDALMTVRELLAGIGEAHSAHSTALLLRDRGVNARFIDLTLWDQQDLRSLDARLSDVFATIDLKSVLPIVTGYAGCEGGMVRRYARGYTEMTFSRLAVLTGAREAVIHKEFHLSSADPKLVGEDKVHKIGRTNYDVADQLANLGMEAIHSGAARGLRQTDIPLRVRNSFDREDSGTLVSSKYISEVPRVEIITGIREMQAFTFFDQNMVGVKGYDAAILDTLTRHNLPIVSKSSNANTITHYLSATAQAVQPALIELQQSFPEADISHETAAMVAAIGSDISRPDLVSDALRALTAHGIAINALQHQIRTVDVQFIIPSDDFDEAIRALHKALIEDVEHIMKERRAA
ncbi:aspartate kinase [Sphingopyxis yananensis]|uniref:aspartate kinase n=1 Tax=Sphingopyxis yananensis TaxID=2886687 RepID=UPI001D13077E|nr:aspartate kinase [Sphingopyxis yananensis]MCC2602362.1 aspartate kinase [Sphingopyxis yananensis]